MLIRQMSAYFVASVVTAIIGVASAIVFTRWLSPAEYGLYVIGVSTAGILSAVLFSWTRLSVMRFQSEGGADVRATALVAYVLSVLACPVALGAAAYLANFSARQSLATLVFTLGIGFFELGQELLRARMQAVRYASGAILRSVAALSFCLLGAYFGGGGLSQLTMAAVAYFFTALVFAPTIWKTPLAKPDRERLKAFLRFGGPATIGGLIYALHASADRLVVARVLGDSAAGQYGAAADLTRQIILLPAGSVACAAIPLAVRAFALKGPAEANWKLAQSFELLFAIVLPAVVGVALTADHIAELILGAEFRSSAQAIMPILAFAWLSQSISQQYVQASFHLAQKPVLIIVHGAGALLVNAALIIGLSMQFGLRGAAASLVIAEAFSMALGFVLTRWAHPLPAVWRSVIKVAIATTVMAFVVIWAKPMVAHFGPVALFILAGLGVAVYSGGAIVLNVADCRNIIQRVVSRRLNAQSQLG